MFPKINFKYAPKKKTPKRNPLTPRTVRVIDNYVKSLHIREIYESDKYKYKYK